MTPLLYILIALGWGGVVWSWARDRMLNTGGRGAAFPTLAGPGQADGPLRAPRTARMARRRRREVLATLAMLALCSFLLARAWSALWVLHLLIDGALLAYLWAVVSLERPDLVARVGTPAPRLETVPAAPRPRPGPRPIAVPEFELDHEPV